MNKPVLFIYRKEGGRQSEQSKKSEIRIHVAGGTEIQIANVMEIVDYH